jgi:hypothetical protein
MCKRTRYCLELSDPIYRQLRLQSIERWLQTPEDWELDDSLTIT